MSELFSVGQDVFYNGKKFGDMRGKRVRIDKIFTDEGIAVCSFNDEGYILRLSNLSKPKGTETWNGKREEDNGSLS